MGWQRGSKRQSEVQWAGRGGVRDKAKCNGLGGGSKRQSEVQWAGRGE